MMLVDKTIGTPWSSEEERRHARLVAGVVYVMSIPGFLYFLHFLQAKIYWMAIAVASTIAISGAALVLLRQTRRPVVAGVIAVSAFSVLLTTSAYSTGGFYGPNFAWLYVIPVFAGLLANMRIGAVFTGLVLIVTFVFWEIDQRGIVLPNVLTEDERPLRSLADRFGAVLAIGVAIAIVASRERLGRRKLEGAYESLKREMQEREQLHERMVQNERLASMGKLSAAVAHEINNPMTYVIGNLQALEEKEYASEEERLELIHDALDGAFRVSSLVRDMRLYAKTPEAPKLASISVAAVLDAAHKIVANRVRHTARFEIECESGITVRASEAELVQVIVNLLTNAIDAMHGPVEENLLRVTAAERDGSVRIEVRDSGTGISIETQKRLFEPFFTTKDIGAGTGMGLATSKALVKSMDGSIDFISTPGEGSVFYLTLPTTDVSEKAPPEERLRILLVMQRGREQASALRTLRRHDVLAEEDPRRALRRCEETSFDAIVSSFALGAMTGEEFCSALALSQPAQAERLVFVATPGESAPRTCPHPVLHAPVDGTSLREALRS